MRSSFLVILTTILCLLALVVAPLAPPAAQDQAPDPKRPELDIRPANHQAWGTATEDVRAILLATAHELWVYFPKRSLKPILVEPLGGPITLFDRGRNGEYRVRLDTGDNLWAQWAYQFAHEFGHILSNYDEVRHPNHWFEESICEVASLFVLRSMAQTWSQDPSPGSRKKYAPALRKYAEVRIGKAKLPEGKTLGQWYEVNARHLAKTGYDRDKNSLVAVQLLPLFEKTPAHWEAITWLAKAKKGHSESFADFLKAWQMDGPEKHRPFVAAIAEQFAIDLDKIKLPPARE
ncbi:hypothetical protein AYO44_03585 [Planctomycetaceae bacterium SCGC AG-212-F19]|nr:hypothetical protein AYO44_03585 [Planctomycetaceae bacterium SCGC AG-212-F19]